MAGELSARLHEERQGFLLYTMNLETRDMIAMSQAEMGKHTDAVASYVINELPMALIAFEAKALEQIRGGKPEVEFGWELFRRDPEVVETVEGNRTRIVRELWDAKCARLTGIRNALALHLMDEESLGVRFHTHDITTWVPEMFEGVGIAFDMKVTGF